MYFFSWNVVFSGRRDDFFSGRGYLFSAHTISKTSGPDLSVRKTYFYLLAEKVKVYIYWFCATWESFYRQSLGLTLFGRCRVSLSETPRWTGGLRLSRSYHFRFTNSQPTCYLKYLVAKVTLFVFLLLWYERVHCLAWDLLSFMKVSREIIPYFQNGNQQCGY